MGLLRIFVAAAVLWLVLPHVSLAQSRDTSKAKARPPTQSVPTPAVAAPCCSVVRVEPPRAVVTARETATGYTFRFHVKSRRLLASIKIGDKVWADFATKTVKLRVTDPAPCCGIIETPPAPEGLAPNVQSSQPQP